MICEPARYYVTDGESQAAERQATATRHKLRAGGRPTADGFRPPVHGNAGSLDQTSAWTLDLSTAVQLGAADEHPAELV
jgi:hypothetical protein